MKTRTGKTIRLPALLAALLLLFAAACLPCYAAGAGGVKIPDAFRTYLKGNAKKGVTSVDVSSFGLPATEEVQTAVKEFLLEETPELFLLKNTVGFSFSDKLLSVSLQYLCSVSEYNAKMKAVEAAADRLLQGIAGNRALTDVQKALLLHDRLAVHCEYDPAVLRDEEAGPNARNIYGGLVERTAVCDGYTRTYMYLLGKVGVKSRMNRSKALGHSWNIVYLDGRAYHVDVTFDDPTYDMTGRVSHENFLLSSSALYRTKHAAADYDTEPSDTRYDDYFWQRSNASFLLAGNQIYYIDSVGATLNRYDGTKVLNLSVDWDGWRSSGKYETPCYARGASDGVVLLFNDKKSVYEYDPGTGKTQTVFTPDTSGGRMIFGMALEGGKLLCEVTETPRRTSADKSGFLVSRAYAERKPAAKIGDVDGDGRITSGDARLALRASVLLEKYAKGSVPYRACDADGDGVISSGDARLILRGSVGLEDTEKWGK